MYFIAKGNIRKYKISNKKMNIKTSEKEKQWREKNEN